MAEPSLKILGIYRPVVTGEIFNEQRETCGSDAATREHFAKLVLVEAIVDGIDQHFRVGDFQQVTPNGGEQVAYDEALLSLDGESVIDRDMNCIKGKPPLRCAFYIHYYDPQRPLRWTYGEVSCPLVQDASERLQRLVPYFPTD